MCSSGEGHLCRAGVAPNGTASPRAGSAQRVSLMGEVSVVSAGHVWVQRAWPVLEQVGDSSRRRRPGWAAERPALRAGVLGRGVSAPQGCTGSLSQSPFLHVQILRHFEASCRQRPPARRPPAELGPAAAPMGPSDLLTDAVPFAGSQAFLRPLSPTLLSPKSSARSPPSDGSSLSVHGESGEAETRLKGPREQGAPSEWSPLGTGSPKGSPALSREPGHGLQSPAASGGCSSLFVGMELVACPRLVGAGTTTGEAPQAPRTLSQKVAAREPPGPESSAFPFLNS